MRIRSDGHRATRRLRNVFWLTTDRRKCSPSVGSWCNAEVLASGCDHVVLLAEDVTGRDITWQVPRQATVRRQTQEERLQQTHTTSRQRVWLFAGPRRTASHQHHRRRKINSLTGVWKDKRYRYKGSGLSYFITPPLAVAGHFSHSCLISSSIKKYIYSMLGYECLSTIRLRTRLILSRNRTCIISYFSLTQSGLQLSVLEDLCV